MSSQTETTAPPAPALGLCAGGNDPEVRGFLIQHPDVCQALAAASPHTAEVFGAGTGVSLQILIDHDGEGDVVLSALVQTPDSVEEALEKRRQFNRRWWSDARKTVKGLNFDVDCAEER